MANLTSSSNGVFSIHGKGLKLTSREDAEPYVVALREMGSEVREIHLGGNTLGVEACEALAEVIKTKSNLEVGMYLGYGIHHSQC
jgi:Ran GTPase-activating protein 1